MEVSKIIFVNGTFTIIINDGVNQIEIPVEISAGDLFDKIASAFYSTQALDK